MKSSFLLKLTIYVSIFLFIKCLFLSDMIAQKDFPSWINQKPNQDGYYFFLGRTSASKKSDALDSAKKDVLVQLLLWMNASIRMQIPFNRLYQQVLPIHFARLKQSYTQMNLRAQSLIHHLEISRQFCSLALNPSNITHCFALGRIPVLLVDKSIQRLKKLHQELKNRSLVILSFVANPFDDRKTIQWQTNDKLSALLGDFYLSQGFTVLDLPPKSSFEPVLDWSGGWQKIINDLPEGVTDLIYVSLDTDRLEPHDNKNIHLFRIHGSLSIRQVHLLTGKTKYIKRFQATGVSLQNPKKAFEQMKHKLLIQLMPHLHDVS